MHKCLIVGLGNIGTEYVHTRHNIGFDIAESFVKMHNGSWRIDRLAEVSEVKIKGRGVIVIKPSTYMNLSGRAMKYWMDKEKVDVENTLTLVDDLALPLDKIRIRPSGSHAGHNGLKDIEAMLGNNVYPKLRFGIGADYPKGQQVDFVLGRWREDELKIIAPKIDICVKAIETFVLAGIDVAMNEFNKFKGQ